MLRALTYAFQRRVKWRPVNIERYVNAEDGHTYSVYWATEPPNSDTPKLYLLLPGLLNSHASKYIDRFVDGFKQRAPTCVLNYPLTNDEATGETIPDYADDRYLREYLEMLQLRYPDIELHVIGFSIGGTVAIKCHDIADRVVAICSPVRGCDAWDSIKHLYFELIRACFLTGPMAKLLKKQPARWIRSAIQVFTARNSRQLTTQLESETGHLIYSMTIEQLLQELPVGKVLMFHTKDDSIIPYVGSDNAVFKRVERVTLERGDHIMFKDDEVVALINRIG